MSADIIPHRGLVNLDGGYCSRMSRRLQAAAIAPAARIWLETAVSGQVIHVFSRVCNIIDEQGRVISVVLSPQPMGPFALRLSDGGWSAPDFQTCVQKGDPVLICGPVLAFGSLQIEVESAPDWMARPDWARVSAYLPAQIDWVEKSITRLLRRAPRESLAGVALTMGRKSVPANSSFAAAVQRAARPLAGQLKRGLVSGNPAVVEDAAAGMAGLGPGLTPAGDDFLLGVLLGLWATRPIHEAGHQTAIIVKAAAPRTTPLSAAWLRASGRGEVDEIWHSLFTALMDGEDSTVDTAGQRILARGHTSGADALAGFGVAMAASCSGFDDGSAGFASHLEGSTTGRIS